MWTFSMFESLLTAVSPMAALSTVHCVNSLQRQVDDFSKLQENKK